MDIRQAARCLVVPLAVAATAGAFAVDWPQFRGPNRDGVSTETGLLKSWPETGPKVLWRAALGEGYSGLAVVRGRLYTAVGQGSDELVLCLDAAGGKELWRTRIDAKWLDDQGNGPRSTPTVDGAMVYLLGGRAKLVALGAQDGKQVWAHDLQQEYGATIPQWGVSSSPLVEGELLLVEVGGPHALFVAFDKKTGKEAWRSQGGVAGYSAPLAINVGGVRQVLFFSGKKLYAVSPKDGSVYWEVPWETSYDVNAAMPVFIAPDKVFISSGYDKGAALLRIKVAGGKPAVESVWQNRVMKNHFSSSVLVGGYLYGFDDKTLKCIDPQSGEGKWMTRGFGHGSLLYADGHLIVLGDHGQLALVEATPQEYREKAKTTPFQTKTWTMPTLVDGKLYLRDQSELIVLQVAAG
ncbi:MAG TPA: PQQ-binding-like beta-propeller repeat protein [Candidatus Polarisedimenticolaceae bacterium]|nr:PQQ-binding-like beta-propeller repeat protein [Candidatus Polarisedimenticolaceae bacterium]